jgi:sec-independent protein translocase protein TatB
MFDFSWGELLLIGVVALIVIGPKELPGVLRMVGQWVGKIRRMAGEFQSQFHEAMREAEMADLKKQVDELNDAARGLTRHFDPMTLGRTPDVPASSSTPPAPTPSTPPAPAAEDAASPPSIGTQDAQSDSPPPEPAAPPVAEKDVAEKDVVTAAPLPSSPEPAPQEAEGSQPR